MHDDTEKKQNQGQTDRAIYSKAAKGGFWVLTARMAAQVLSMARLIVLAWILAPSDFGLMGVALFTLAFLETFTETGFIPALVQKSELDRADLDSAWSVSLIRGVLIFLVICLAAPLVASFFEHSSNAAQAQAATANHALAVWVIRAFALTVVFRSVTNIGIVFFRRELQFNKLFIIDTTGLVVDVMVAIVTAVLFRSVWSLVLGKLAGESVRAAMSYIMHSYRPSFRIDRTRCDKLWHFGKWVFWSTVSFYFLSQGDSLVVGRVLGLAALGLYAYAGRIASLPSTEIINVISQVAFPAYSQIKDDMPRLRNAYLLVLKATNALSFPLAGAIIVFASDFTHVFLKEEWWPIIPVMQVLALNGLITCIGSTTAPAFQAVGKPQATAQLLMVKLAIVAVLIYPFTLWWSITGTAATLLTATILMQPLMLTVFRRTVGCRISDILRVCRIPFVITLCMVLVVMALRSLLDLQPSLYGLGSLALIAAAVYVAGVLLADKLLGYGMLATAKQIISEVAGKRA
jgi:lipopolysaccharide exporter